MRITMRSLPVSVIGGAGFNVARLTYDADGCGPSQAAASLMLKDLDQFNGNAISTNGLSRVPSNFAPPVNVLTR